ncbi:MAG TPA: extracellular solute-binding protein [Clostridiales bacterium]|nr:extracellular solute-binding protein [Clostridiales bacterium]
MKKFIAILLCTLLIFSTFSACKKAGDANNSNNPDNSTSGDASPASTSGEGTGEPKTVDFSEHKEFSYWLFSSPNDFYSDYSDNPGLQYLNEKFNMTLKCQQPVSGTEQESLNLMFGTGEYTDMIDVTSYTGSIDKLYEDDVIINIADYLDYMPNFKKLLDENEAFRKNIYSDDGKILKLSVLHTRDQLMWGGLVYRYDILKTMTGDNVKFPSGNAEPTTIEDWDYMLPLFKQYFEAAGMQDYAPLIIPAYGYFPSNDLISSFGASMTYYMDNGTVKYGPIEDGFYNYLKKMNEWYEAGYIYKDFASRTTDMFYLPNTSLTYGGAAGIWFGLTSQVGDRMSMPDYGLYVDVRGLKNPIDAKNGITTAPNRLYSGRFEDVSKVVITSACEDIERLLTTLDYLYTEEGSLLKTYGLTKEQGADRNEIMINNGLEEGSYTLAEDGTIIFNSNFTFMGGNVDNMNNLAAARLPGLANMDNQKVTYTKEAYDASQLWVAYQKDDNKLPVGVSRTIEEDQKYTSNQANIDDYLNSMILKFIMGTEELNDSSWEDFKAQIKAFGVEENIAINQAAYERYNNR